MNKKTFVLLIALLAVILMGCNKKEQVEEPVPTNPETEAGVVETIAETVPGVEDSIFDTEQEETKSEETEPEETKFKETEAKDSEGDDDQKTENATKPTAPPSAGSSTKPTAPPVEDEPAAGPSTKPSPDEDETDDNTSDVQSSDYEDFQKMTPAEQQAYMSSFDSIEAFFAWYEAAKAEHEAANPPIDVGDGNIDLDEIIGGNN